jgi:YggT family protein
MRALHYIVSTLLSLYLSVLLLRFIMQLVRADFRNPIALAITKITNPLILPLRKVLPPVGKLDTASIVAIVVFALASIALLSVLFGVGLPATLPWLQAALIEILVTLLRLYFGAILVYAILSWVAGAMASPVGELLGSLCEPILAPFRRVIPPIGGLDLSALWALIAIQALMMLLQ